MSDETAAAGPRSAWLCILRATRTEMLTDGPTKAEDAIVGEHFARLMRGAAEGRMHLFGRTDAAERTIGLVVFEAADEAEARAIVASDPAVAGGVMTAELFPYRIAYLRGLTPRPE